MEYKVAREVQGEIGLLKEDLEHGSFIRNQQWSVHHGIGTLR
jgi:hypothetical protein